MRHQEVRRGWVPILTLYFVAPVVGELVGSGNIPPILFLIPIFPVFFGAVYGIPALLVRELWVRRRVGWPGMLLLGFAYGAYNEGVIANKWFARPGSEDALHMTARELGRSHGVNLNLVANLTIFHTFVSMFISIALVQLWFGRERSAQPWLRRRGVVISSITLALIGIARASNDRKHGHSVPAANHGARMATLLLIVACVLIALALPRLRIRASERSVPALRPVLGWGALWSAAYLFLFFGIPKIAPAAVPAGAILFWLLTVMLLLRWCGSRHWTPRHTLFMISGVLGLTMLVTVWRVVLLQPVSSGLFVWWLVHIDRRLRHEAV